MLKESFFVNIVIKICSFLMGILEKSFIWNFLRKCNCKFNRSTENSLIVNAVSNKGNADALYEAGYGKIFSLISNIFKKCFTWLADSVKASKIVAFASDLSSNFLAIPLKFPGIFLLVWGIVALIGNYFLNASKTALLLCVLIAIFGAIFVLLNKNLAELVSGSFILSNFIPIKGEIITKKCNYKSVIMSGIISGLFSVIFGILPVAAIIVLFLVITIGFYFTWQVALLYVCVLPFMPTMAMVGGGIALFMCVAIKSLLGYNSKLFNNSYVMNMYLLFMGIAFALGAIFSYARNSSIKIALVYIAFLLVTYALIRILAEKKVLLNVLNGVSIFSIPVSLYGIYQHFSGFDKQNTWIDTEMFEDISGRVVSFFGNPNVFGEYLILIILTSVICFFITSNYKFKAVHLFAGVCSLVSLVFTYSRGCWIGLVFAMVIFLFLSKRKLFIVFCALGCVSIFFLPDSIISRIASVGNLADSSTSYRVYIWEGTLNMLKDFWITGIGLGSDAFNAVYPFYAYSAITAPHPHNLYLVILTETGIVGAIAFLLIVLIYYKKLFAVIKHSDDKNMKVISSGLVAAMSGFLLQGMFDNVWYNYRVFLLFWIYIALGAIVDVVSGRNKA